MRAPHRAVLALLRLETKDNAVLDTLDVGRLRVADAGELEGIQVGQVVRLLGELDAAVILLHHESVVLANKHPEEIRRAVSGHCEDARDSSVPYEQVMDTIGFQILPVLFDSREISCLICGGGGGVLEDFACLTEDLEHDSFRVCAKTAPR